MLDVYRTYYKMTGEPFRLSPDHRFSLAHSSYANAMSYLQYAIFQGEGFIAVTGGPGTGKTTLISDLIQGLDKENIEVATLTSTQLESRDLLQMVVHLFDLRPEDKSKPGLLQEMEQFLNKQNYKGRRVILIVDEAQSLTVAALEELRLLANLQRNHQLLLQVFLVGQEQLLDLLRAPGMEQMHQRLIAASHLLPLGLDEVIDYIEHRLSRVGWKGDPKIDEGALRLIHRHSGGIPRRINLICNRLFLYGGLEQKHEFVVDDARLVIEELHKEFLLSSDPVDENESEKDAEPGDDADAPVRSLPRKDMNAETVKTPEQPSSKAPPESRPRPKSAKPTPDKARRASGPADNKKKAADRTARERVVGSRKRIEPTMRREPTTGAARPAPAPKPAQSWKNSAWGKTAAFVVLAGLVYAAFFGGEDADPESTSDDVNEVKPRAAFNAPLDSDAPVQEAPSGNVEAEDATQTAATEAPPPMESAASTATDVETSSPGEDVPPVKDAADAPSADADGGQNGTAASSSPVLPAPPEPEPVARVSEKANVAVPEAPEAAKPGGSIKVASAPTPKPVEPVKTVKRQPVKIDTGTIEAEKARLRREAELRLAMNLNRVEPGRETAIPAPVKVAPAPVKKPPPPPVASKPKAPVKVATAPKIKPAPKRSPLDKLKATLLEGQWDSRGKPASLLPSKVTYCNSKGTSIACLSVPQDIKTKYGAALYKVETTLGEFSANQDFQLSYRTLVKLLGDDSDGSREAALSSDTGWQISEYSMSCKLIGSNQVQCRDKKGVTRDYRRSKQR